MTRKTKSTPQANDSSSPEPVPPGWRPEWRKPKPKRATGPTAAIVVQEVVARARACAEPVELPPREVLRSEAVAVLRAIALATGELGAARVGAAKAILDVTEPRIEDMVAAALGSDEAALAWMEATLPVLRAKVGKLAPRLARGAPPMADDGQRGGNVADLDLFRKMSGKAKTALGAGLAGGKGPSGLAGGKGPSEPLEMGIDQEESPPRLFLRVAGVTLLFDADQGEEIAVQLSTFVHELRNGGRLG
jgi:hypothetical protein